MHHVVLFGAGNQGVRHLESLMKIQEPLRISVVDPSDQALFSASACYKQFSFEGKVKEVRLFHSMVDLDDTIDVALIATHADAKRGIVEQLMRQTLVKHLLIDPVVFQAKKDFIEMLPLLARHQIQTWVMNPRLYYPIYDEVRKFFKPQATIEFQAHGGNWGVAARAIDFADLFSRLQGSFSWDLDASQMNKTVNYNYRRGSMELKGSLTGKGANKSRFQLLEYEGNSPLVVQVQDRNYRFIIKEDEGQVIWSQAATDFKAEPFDLRPPSKGVVTNLIVQDLVTQGRCKLTSLEELSPLHIAVNEALRRHIEECQGKRWSYCPIS